MILSAAISLLIYRSLYHVLHTYPSTESLNTYFIQLGQKKLKDLTRELATFI